MTPRMECSPRRRHSEHRRPSQQLEYQEKCRQSMWDVIRELIAGVTTLTRRHLGLCMVIARRLEALDCVIDDLETSKMVGRILWCSERVQRGGRGAKLGTRNGKRADKAS